MSATMATPGEHVYATTFMMVYIIMAFISCQRRAGSILLFAILAWKSANYCMDVKRSYVESWIPYSQEVALWKKDKSHAIRVFPQRPDDPVMWAVNLKK